MIRATLATCGILLGTLLPLRVGSTALASERRNQKSVESYVVPDVTLTNQDGIKIGLRSILQANKPVMLDFIYSSCTTTCPVLSAGFARVQERIAPATEDIQLVSISVDPVNDTPAVMKEYLKRYRAKPGWDYLTGSVDDVAKVMKAFRLREMSYNYFVLIRRSPDEKWTKITGAINTADVVNEYLE